MKHMKNLDKLKTKCAELGEEIKRVEEKVVGWQPEEGEKYYYIDDEGFMDFSAWLPLILNERYKYIKNFLGVFKTEEEGEKKLELVKALCPVDPWVPKYGEEYCYSYGKKSYWSIYVRDEIDIQRLATGNMFKTKEEAEKYRYIIQGWGNRYKK